MGQVGGVGVEEVDGSGVALGGKADRLVDELFREVEGGETAVAKLPEAEGHPAGAAAGFEQMHFGIGEEALDQRALRGPQTQLVRGAGVVHHREKIVEIGADGLGGYFLFFHAAMNIPFALISWGQNVSWEGTGDGTASEGAMGNGSSSGCAAVKASATAVVSLRVRVQTA